MYSLHSLHGQLTHDHCFIECLKAIKDFASFISFGIMFHICERKVLNKIRDAMPIHRNW